MEVVPFCGQNEADVDINTKNSKSDSGSNGTMQIVIASILFFYDSKKKFSSAISTPMTSAATSTVSTSISEPF